MDGYEWLHNLNTGLRKKKKTFKKKFLFGLYRVFLPSKNVLFNVQRLLSCSSFLIGRSCTLSFIITWIPWNLSIRYITLNWSIYTKDDPGLLSSLMWIDSGIVVSQHRLESFFHETKCNRMTSFMEFMLSEFQDLLLPFTAKQS